MKLDADDARAHELRLPSIHVTKLYIVPLFLGSDVGEKGLDYFLKPRPVDRPKHC